MKKQAGFTLIELIMVIVILGILSAFALPRFVDFSSRAEIATNQGIIGAVRSTVSISRAACLAEPSCSSTEASTVTLEGQSFDTFNGYLDAAAVHSAAQISGFTEPTPVGRTITTPSTVTWTLNAGCSVQYSEPYNNGTDNFPFALTATGC